MCSKTSNNQLIQSQIHFEKKEGHLIVEESQEDQQVPPVQSPQRPDEYNGSSSKNEQFYCYKLRNSAT